MCENQEFYILLCLLSLCIIFNIYSCILQSICENQELYKLLCLLSSDIIENHTILGS